MMKIRMIFIRFAILLGFTVNAWAGFLDMPDIEEVPEAENEILLKDLDIPPVRDRIPNPEAGPRINVTAFRVQGVVEFPALGITRENLIKIVEGSRYNIMKEGEMLYSGYTSEELSELQDLIVDIEKETRKEHVSPLDVQRLVFLIRDQRRRRGVTLGMLEDVADKVTNYYRQRGFILAKAFIPEQHVRDGVVTLTLLLGDLGQVEFTNNKRYSSKIVDRIFADVMHKPVTTDLMEEKLYYLNDIPGLSVQGFFGPGEQVGDTKLSVSALKEQAYNVNFRLDNHGSDVTGEYRLYGDLILNSPLKYGDKLHLALLGATEPESAEYGSIRYGGPLFSHRWHFDVGASQNAFVLGLEQEGKEKTTTLDIGGVSKSVDFGVNYQFSRSRVKNTSAGVSIVHIDAKVDNAGNGNHDVVNNVRLSYHFDFLDEKDKVIHNGTIMLTGSLLEQSGSNDNTSLDPEFDFADALIFSANYSSVRFLEPHFGIDGIRWVTRASAQYAGQRLSSINQFSLSGPTLSRGYKTNTFFADDGVYLGSELLFNQPKFLGKRSFVQPYVFSDIAYGVVYSSRPVDKVVDGFATTAFVADNHFATLLDVGMGVKFTLPGSIKGNLSIAKPIRTVISEELDIEEIKDAKVYFDVQYSY